MDRMYRYQKHIYDVTRRFYLLGRDRLLDSMEVAPGDTVLEVGCGTARNLVTLARRTPDAVFCGLDVSRQMLQKATAKLERAGLGNVLLRHCSAEGFDYRRTFALERPFSAALFSYSLSMIPQWPRVLDVTLANLAAGGRIYIVDFWDQADLPSAVSRALKAWLALFGVRHEPALIRYLETLHRSGRLSLEVESVARRYAFVARMSGVRPA
jgi:S-adenosylmethionine-diacylgycerolhomoserine-N-methlytransferase